MENVMLGIGEAISAVSNLGRSIVERVWPDATEIEKNRMLILADEISNEFKLLLGQIEINKIEAKSDSIFVAGWRPLIGWSCGFSLIYASLIEPFARFIAVVFLEYSGRFPVIDTNLTLQILLAMLGIAGMRSFDKSKGGIK